MELEQAAIPDFDASKAFLKQARHHFASLGSNHPETLTSAMLTELSIPQPTQAFKGILQFLKAGGEVEFSLDGDRQGCACSHTLVRTRRGDE